MIDLEQLLIRFESRLNGNVLFVENKSFLDGSYIQLDSLNFLQVNELEFHVLSDNASCYSINLDINQIAVFYESIDNIIDRYFERSSRIFFNKVNPTETSFIDEQQRIFQQIQNKLKFFISTKEQEAIGIAKTKNSDPNYAITSLLDAFINQYNIIEEPEFINNFIDYILTKSPPNQNTLYLTCNNLVFSYFLTVIFRSFPTLKIKKNIMVQELIIYNKYGKVLSSKDIQTRALPKNFSSMKDDWDKLVLKYSYTNIKK
jgi:hypothetical protein